MLSIKMIVTVPIHWTFTSLWSKSLLRMLEKHVGFEAPS